jgi:hypothetical protein
VVIVESEQTGRDILRSRALKEIRGGSILDLKNWAMAAGVMKSKVNSSERIND